MTTFIPFFVIFFILIAFLFYWFNRKNDGEVYKKTVVDSSELHHDKKLFLEKLNRRMNLVKILSIGFLVLVLSMAFMYILFEDYNLQNPSDFQPLKAQLKFAFQYGSIPLIIGSPIVWLVYRHLNKLQKQYNAVILETNEEEFKNVVKYNQYLFFYQKYMPPIIFSNGYLYTYQTVKMFSYEMKEIDAVYFWTGYHAMMKGSMYMFGIKNKNGNIRYFGIRSLVFGVHLVTQIPQNYPHIELKEYKSLKEMQSDLRMK